MKKLLLPLSLLLLAQVAVSQAYFDNRVKQTVRCADVSDFAHQMAPYYIQKNQIDSLELLMIYWDDKCGSNGVIKRINQMIKIHKGDTDNDWFTLSAFQEMLGVRGGRPYYYDSYFYEENYREHRTAIGNIEKLEMALKDWSRALLQEQDKCSDLYGYLLFSSGDSDQFFDWVKSECAATTQLANHYQNEVTRFQKMWYTDIGGFIEIWSPYQGKINQLGPRGGFGFYIGEHHKRFYYTGTMILRIGGTPQPYQVVYKNDIVETDYFLGWYFGGDVGYAVAKTSNFGIYALGGIGYDGFETLAPDDNYNSDDPSYSLKSLNLNSGLGFRHRVGTTGYVGAEGRYNWVKYDNPGGTNLEGDFISVRLIIGGLVNYNKQQGLDALRVSDFRKRK